MIKKRDLFTSLICGVLLMGFTLKAQEKEAQTSNEIFLNLRVHIMKTEPWTHPLGVEMSTWVTPKDVKETILPEVNRIWDQAGIKWQIESIIEEDIRKFQGYKKSINFVINTKRNEQGRSDPKRLPHLNKLMQKQYKSTEEELGTNLFHIYLFPFIGNTSQGNAMRGFGFHTVLGTWSNKHNRGGIPEKILPVENPNSFKRGSLSRTIAHELGHVLNLKHNQCDNCLMKARGYSISTEQIQIARKEAVRRSK